MEKNITILCNNRDRNGNCIEIVQLILEYLSLRDICFMKEARLFVLRKFQSVCPDM